MIYSAKNNKKNNLNLEEFTSVARRELVKYATYWWAKHFYSQHEATSWHIKIDKINELLCILDKIEYKRLHSGLDEFDASSFLVEFKSVLTAFKSTFSKKGQEALFTESLSFLAKFFKLSPKIKATLQEPSQARWLVKNLEVLLEKTQESICLSLSCQELLLAFSAFQK